MSVQENGNGIGFPSARDFASIYMSERTKAIPEKPVKTSYCLKHRYPTVNGVCLVCEHYAETGVTHNEFVERENESARTSLPARQKEEPAINKSTMIFVLLVVAFVVGAVIASFYLKPTAKTKAFPATARDARTAFKI